MNFEFTDTEKYLMDRISAIINPMGSIVPVAFAKNIRLLQDGGFDKVFRTFPTDDIEYIVYHLGELYMKLMTDYSFLETCVDLIDIARHTSARPPEINGPAVTVDLTNINDEFVDSFIHMIADGRDAYKIYDDVLAEHIIIFDDIDSEALKYVISNFAYLLKSLTLKNGLYMKWYRLEIERTEEDLAYAHDMLSDMDEGWHFVRHINIKPVVYHYDLA